MKYRIVEHIQGAFEAQAGNEANEWRHIGVFKTFDEASAKLAEVNEKGFVDFVLIHNVEFSNEAHTE